LISEGHPVSKLGRSRDVLGGPFVLVKRTLHERTLPGPSGVRLSENPIFGGSGGDFIWSYSGNLFAKEANVFYDSYPELSIPLDIDIDAWGASAIANTIPTNPLAGLSTFLGELHEGLPRIIGADFFKDRAKLARHAFRNAGSEYLNREFGWLPLISDVRKFAFVVQNANALIDRYEKNSGKRIKRKFSVDLIDDHTVVDEGLQLPSPNIPTNIFRGSGYRGPRILTTTHKHRRSFSGCFTYYLEPYHPGGDNRRRTTQLANKLLGTRVTPEVLWNLAPWSWAADWFANIGDVLHNVSAFMSDGLLMPYAYVMDYQSITKSYALTGIEIVSEPLFDGVFYQDFTTEVKYRRGANPFGFGLTYDGLTLRQKAIASAIGLTRGRGKR
jgi:hypothetical protein